MNTTDRKYDFYGHTDAMAIIAKAAVEQDDESTFDDVEDIVSSIMDFRAEIGDYSFEVFEAVEELIVLWVAPMELTEDDIDPQTFYGELEYTMDDMLDNFR